MKHDDKSRPLTPAETSLLAKGWSGACAIGDHICCKWEAMLRCPCPCHDQSKEEK